MPFEYSCFISYTTGQRALMRRIVTDLDEALSNELDARTAAPAFLARERLEGGNFQEEVISQALCKSVCMIMLFTPRYFNPEATYCAREYVAMENLEKERFARAGIKGDATNGLIIPVIFRGWEHFPTEIKKRRQCYDFKSFTMADRRMSKHRKYADEIVRMATYVHERCLTFQAQDALFSECEEFKLPTHNEVRDLAAALAPHAPAFPGW